MDLILDFRKLNKSSLPLVGGKNASLGEMINADIRVCGVYGESRN
jgi:phosphoenolpyruvate synthase/pyruvate phosphate dikinase